MLNSLNPTAQYLAFVGAGLACPVAGRALPERPAVGLDKTTTAVDSATELCQLAPKLDFRLNCTKHATSHFLIDNFRACILRRSSQQPVHPDVGRVREPDRASSLKPPASRNSNRHIPELESPVSCRKQRIGPISNRHKTAFCNFVSFRHCSHSVPVTCHLPLILIANETHSRKQSSACKQSIYKILIAIEFHSQIASEIAPRDRQHKRHIKLRYNGRVGRICTTKGDKK